MPLGNGDIGLNVWGEAGGDLLFYISKTDAWDENSRLLKLGRVRVSLSPNPFVSGQPFRQELDLASGCIRISSAIEERPLTVLLWVDAHRPVVRVSVESTSPVAVRVALELWRTEERLRDVAEASNPVAQRHPDDRESVFPDIVLDVENGLAWCHRNRQSCWAATLEHQDMPEWIGQGEDPLLDRTFGALLRSDHGLAKENPLTLRTENAITHAHFSIHALTAQTHTLDSWIEMLDDQAQRSDATPHDAAYREHVEWWQSFWCRSWIHITGDAEAETVSRGYELQRFINACGGRGAFPIKFNGSIFTVDAREPKERHDADYRRWGGGYWFQNTRLTYWPMIMAGDFDLMTPWFRMYLAALPFAKARAKACFGVDDAAFFPETMTFWGAFLNANYGFDRADLPPGLSQNTYIRRYWQGMLELVAILLDAYAVTQDERLLHDVILELAPPMLRFYRDIHPRRDESGKMLFSPSQSLETWHDAINPSPDIAGLDWVLNGLLDLPQDSIPEELRREWREFRDVLPPLPTRTWVWEKRTVVLPALQYDQCANSENPELYTVFPYRLFGVGKPDLEIGRATWEARVFKETGGWRQDAIQAAFLGLADDAKRDVVKNFSTPHEGSRFPVFWGPNFDWIPDQDHGSVACIALQRMLLQCDDGRIHMLPAWPKDWDVEFRLHAPGRTVVECRVEGGVVRELRVTPESRRQDMVMDVEPV